MTAPIRMIARDLYVLQRKVVELEERQKILPKEERASVEDRLRKLRAERDRMKKVLEGNKEPPSCRRPL